MFRLLFAITILLALSLPGTALALTCTIKGCHPFLQDLKNLHAPVKEGKCLSCHVQKEEMHPYPGLKAFELKAKGVDLCYLCHDKLAMGPVVHGPVRDGDCTACHRYHGASGPKLLDMGEDQTAFCTGCHDEGEFRRHYQHGPAAVGDCTSCHTHHSSTEKKLLKEQSRQLCLSCHNDFAQTMAKAPRVHPPVSNDACTSCHNPHSSASQFVLKEKMPDLCYGCHSAMATKVPNVKVPHKPISQAKSCGSCHSAHFSPAKGLLAVDQKNLCLGCHGQDGLHSSKVFREYSGLPLVNMKKALDKKSQLHGPINDGACAACHSPHGSDNFRMLVKSYPAPFYVPYKEGLYDLCFSCHDKSMLKYPDTTLYTNFRNGKQNLHYLHVSDKRKGRTCRACHDAHAVNDRKLIGADGAVFGKWKIPTRFKTTATGGSCAPGCHRQLSYDREKPVSYTPQKEAPKDATKEVPQTPPPTSDAAPSGQTK